jgi:four helix bundle protein
MKFVAEHVALEMIRSVRPRVSVIARHDGDLARQIRRAATSVASNVSEGNRRRGKDRTHLFRIAAGSADEVRAQLRCAEAWGHVSARDIAAPLALLDRELGLLYGLTERARR